jgi:hypothetical protein
MVLRVKKVQSLGFGYEDYARPSFFGILHSASYTLRTMKMTKSLNSSLNLLLERSLPLKTTKDGLSLRTSPLHDTVSLPFSYYRRDLVDNGLLDRPSCTFI